MSLWRYPVSGEPPSLPLAELPDKSAFGQAPLATDAQYILVVDANNPNVYLETLLWKRSNDAMWLFHTFDLSKFSGKKIRLRLGTYNDGNDQITAQYFDDISLQLCSAATPPPPSPPPPPPPPPPPAGCSERVLNNSLEINGYWTIPVTAYSAGYSSIFVHTGLRSMRTGIYYAGHNRYSYSDFRQAVYIPWSSSSATLRYYVYPYSEESWSSPAPDRPTALEFGQAAMSGDVQYLLILNSAQYWIDTLLWQRSNAQTWIYVEQNLLGYRGSTINLQFGTYNNGYDGVTAMWVDDVSLVTCP